MSRVRSRGRGMGLTAAERMWEPLNANLCDTGVEASVSSLPCSRRQDDRAHERLRALESRRGGPLSARPAECCVHTAAPWQYVLLLRFSLARGCLVDLGVTKAVTRLPCFDLRSHERSNPRLLEASSRSCDAAVLVAGARSVWVTRLHAAHASRLHVVADKRAGCAHGHSPRRRLAALPADCSGGSGS